MALDCLQSFWDGFSREWIAEVQFSVIWTQRADVPRLDVHHSMEILGETISPIFTTRSNQMRLSMWTSEVPNLSIRIMSDGISLRQSSRGWIFQKDNPNVHDSDTLPGSPFGQPQDSIEPFQVLEFIESFYVTALHNLVLILIREAETHGLVKSVYL